MPLVDLCIASLSRHIHLFDCLENLPDFVSKKILQRFERFFKRRVSQVDDAKVVAFVELLNIGYCNNERDTEVGAASVDAIPKGRSMLSLNLPWCHKLTNQGICELAKQERLCHNLRVVNLAFCSQVGDGAVEAIAHHCPNLVAIDLTFTAVGDAGVKALVTYHSRSLERLCLEQCTKITDRGVQALARGFSKGRLTNLNLGGLSKVTNVGIQILSSHLSTLRALSLSGCTCLIDFDVEDICKSLILLEDFSLRSCRRLTDTSVRRIARLALQQTKRARADGDSLPRRNGVLRSLDIGGCTRITARGVICVVKALRGLQKLDLRGLGASVNDEGLGLIRERLKHLRSLNLQSCQVTESGIRDLKQKNSHVDIIGRPQSQTTNENKK